MYLKRRVLAAILLASASLACAQEADVAARQVYMPADFERFAPRTALDMARQIPGFILSDTDSRRGLGQASQNVLINGERISGKSNDAVDALERIPADKVVRLEIVDGASLDVPGLSGQVLNAVVTSQGISGQFRYSPSFRSRGTSMRFGNFEASASGGSDRLNWTLSIENDQFRDGSAGLERVFDREGNIIDIRDESGNFDGEVPTLSGSLAWRPENGHIANFTGEIGGFFFDSLELSERTGLGRVDRLRTFTEEEDEFDYEIGADYEFALLGGRLKLIGLRNFENSPRITIVDTEFADGRPRSGSRFETRSNEAETIARGEYKWKMLGGDWQASLEGALNILDRESTLLVRDADGVLQPRDFPGASARVEEERAETTLSYGRPLGANVQLQTLLGGEYSRISQTGPFGLTRDFYRAKGFVSIDWSASDDLDISARIEREVGQLDFFDFIATVSLSTDVVDVVNANLVPPQSWIFEVEATQSLGAFGSITARLFDEEIEDIVDQIPIRTGGEAPGNIDSARRYGIDVSATLLGEPVGFDGAKLDVEVQYRDSELEDPTTLTLRPISDDLETEVDIDFRHDIPRSDWAWGASFFHSDESDFHRLSQVNRFRGVPGFVEAFVENKDVIGLTLRGSVGNLIGQSEKFTRTVFVDRRDGIVDFVEARDRTFGLIYTLTIEGSF